MRISPQAVQELRSLVSSFETDTTTTVAEGTERFAREHAAALKNRTQVAYREALRGLRDVLGDVPLAELCEGDIDLAVAGLTPGKRSAYFSCWSSCLRWLDRNGHHGLAAVVPERRPKSRMRTSYVHIDDYRHLHAAFAYGESHGWAVATSIAACRIASLIPARISELVALRSTDLDARNRVLALPDSKTGQRYVPIGRLGAALLSARLGSGEYLFPATRRSNTPHITASGLSHAFKKILRRYRDAGGKDLSECCFHSLRHSWASAALNRGVPIEHVRSVLGHGSTYATERYGHLTNHDVRAAIDSLQDEMAQSVSLQAGLAWTEVSCG